MRSVAIEIVALLQKKGFEAYFAGGCVRDELLGLKPKDYDIATSARPEEVEALFPGQSDLVGKSFGVVIVREAGVLVEVATFRSDGIYQDGRHPESVTFSDAEEDARRRDFTINALFFDPIKKEVKDFVEGQKDLSQKILRAVGDPKKRFSEDKLRILRGIRIASALDCQIESHTWQAMKDEAASIVQVSPERIRDELNKWLVAPNPVKGLDLLDESGLLQILLPEITAMKNVQQPPQFHPEGDVYTHVRLMLSQVKKPTEALAWSVLLHDVGKPATYAVDGTGRIRFNGHETVGASISRKILTRLRFSNMQTDRICAMVANHMGFKDVPHMRLSTLKKLMARETFEEELELHRVDCLSSHRDLSIYQELVKQKEKFTKEEIKPKSFLNGKDIITRGLAPGPRIGELLKMAYDLQLEGKLKTREQALEWMDQKLESNDNDEFSKTTLCRIAWLSISSLIFLLILLCEWSGAGKIWEEKQWNWIQSLAFPRRVTLSNAVIVEIDKSTLMTHGAGKWPLSSLTYAMALQALRGQGARGVGIEMVLSKSGEATVFDSALMNQINRTPNTVLAISAIPDEGPFLQTNKLAPLSVSSERISRLPLYKGVLLPRESLATESALGFNNLPLEGDGMIRKIPLVFRFENKLYPSFLLQCILQNEGLTPSAVKWDQADQITLEKNGYILFSIPVDKEGKMRVKIPSHFSYEKVGLDNLVLSANLPKNQQTTNVWSLHHLQNKFVFIGRSDPSIYDSLPTSMGELSPIQLQAIGWQAIYAQKYISRISLGLQMIIGLAATVFIVGFSMKYSAPWPIIAWVFLVVDLVFLSIFLISMAQQWLPLTNCLIAVTLGLISGMIWKTVKDRSTC